MTPTVRRLHMWYGIFLAVFTIVVGILFISQAADIYYSGVGYSRELVVERCTTIAAPFWIWVAAVIAGGIIWTVFPEDKKKLKRLPDARGDAERFYKLAAKESDKPGFDEAAQAVARDTKIRKIVWLSCMGVCLVCAAVGMAFLFNLPSYPSDPNDAILGLVRSVLPCVLVAFAACIGATIYDGIAAKKVLPHVKKMLALGGRSQEQAQPGKIALALQSPVTLLIVRIAIIIVAIVFIVLGVFNGGMNDVLIKAINICTECIGMG